MLQGMHCKHVRIHLAAPPDNTNFMSTLSLSPSVTVTLNRLFSDTIHKHVTLITDLATYLGNH